MVLAARWLVRPPTGKCKTKPLPFLVRFKSRATLGRNSLTFRTRKKFLFNRNFFLAFQIFPAIFQNMKAKKKLVRTVDLRFFQDDANGEWGVTHKETCPGNGNGEEFNAFWDGRGIFHDVFEHAHEFTDKHFRK